MSKKTKALGETPSWLKERVERSGEQRQLVETEVKYLLPKDVLSSLRTRDDVTVQELDQVYLTGEMVAVHEEELALPPGLSFREWRIRRIDDKLLFTAKGKASADGTQRAEYEVGIGADLFEQLLDAAREAGALRRVAKTRYSFPVAFADDTVLVQLDDYHETGQREVELDFVSCEIEVHRPELAGILIRGCFFAPDLLLLKRGVNVTGISEFSNRELSEHGFPAEKYHDLVAWLDHRTLRNLDLAQDAIQRGDVTEGVRLARAALDEIEQRSKRETGHVDSNDFSLTQDVLKDLAFTTDQSMGRKDTSDEQLRMLDRLGKGWLRDYHVIISADGYIRLDSKPQIFRPGIGYANTTTRGAHTSDVVACSMQLARQLGLNVELCMAAAALHDIGHPAGGHVGEKVIKKKSGRTFQHHVFSLWLAEVFGMNLTREVMECALYHKSGGKSLHAPKGRRQEYGVVRLADKISYCPWDLFDSIENEFLTPDQVIETSKQANGLGGLSVFDILGDTPMEWIWTLTAAAVKESAEAHRVRFSEKSGQVYAAYLEARRIVYEEVHPRIYWGSLEAQLDMAYDKIAISFPDIEDIVPIVAYVTDQELGQLTRIIENEPKTEPLSLDDLRAHGFGFCELIKKILALNTNDNPVYYNSGINDKPV